MAIQTALDLAPPVDVGGSAVTARAGALRLEIRRWWAPEPRRMVAWLMLNPSLANAERSDMTAGRVDNFTRAWGYDGWIGVNIYPLVSSAQPALWRWADWMSNGPDWSARDDLHHNLEWIEKAGRAAHLRMVAFGAQPVDRDEPWLEQCLEAFGQPSDHAGADERLYCLGCNKTGQPLHPMARGKWRVPDGTLPTLWRDG